MKLPNGMQLSKHIGLTGIKIRYSIDYNNTRILFIGINFTGLPLIKIYYYELIEY